MADDICQPPSSLFFFACPSLPLPGRARTEANICRHRRRQRFIVRDRKTYDDRGIVIRLDALSTTLKPGQAFIDLFFGSGGALAEGCSSERCVTQALGNTITAELFEQRSAFKGT